MAFPGVSSTAESNLTTAGTSFPITFTQTTGHLVLIIVGSSGAPWDLTGVKGFAPVFFSGSPALAAYYKTLDGTEGGTVSATNGASNKGAAIAYNLTGASTTTAPESSTLATGTSTAPDATTCTPTGGAKDYRFITTFHQVGEEADDDTWVTGTPTNYGTLLQKTSDIAGATSANCSIASAIRSQLNAASEDAGAFTTAQSLAWKAYTIAIHPPDAASVMPSRSNQVSQILAH